VLGNLFAQPLCVRRAAGEQGRKMVMGYTS